MNQGLIPRRYAKALYLLASEKNRDKEIYQAMFRLSDVFNDEPKLQTAIANPHVSAQDKLALICVAANVSSDSLVGDMVKLIERNNRTNLLREIALAYINIYRSKHHIYQVTITSAMPLQPAEFKRIQSLIINHLPEEALPEFSEKVNPNLIGGFTVSIDNELLDASVAADFKQLRLKLLSH